MTQIRIKRVYEEPNATDGYRVLVDRTDKLTDEQRWDFIEDYFTGMGVDDLKKKFVSL